MQKKENSTHSPMMEQYLNIKKNHQDKFVLFRLGDFYELFFDDAVEGSKLMEIILTNRHGVPMCGMPHHQLKNYTAKLLQSGKKVAIVEQSTEQETGTLIKREVREILTPASLIDETLLQEKENNFLLTMAINNENNENIIACCQCDLSTGEIFLATIKQNHMDWQTSVAEILSITKAKEILLVGENTISKIELALKEINPKLLINKVVEEFTNDCLDSVKKYCKKNAQNFTEMGFTKTLAATFDYLRENRGVDHKTIFSILLPPIFRPLQGNLILDERTKLNLEIFQSNSRDEELTLIATIDHTQTPMGARRLRQEFSIPMLSYEEIRKRLDRVQWWTKNIEKLNNAKKKLQSIKDISRMATRIALRQANCEEIILFQSYLQKANYFAKFLIEIDNDADIFHDKTEISYNKNYLQSLLCITEYLCQKITEAIVYDDEEKESIFNASTKKTKARLNLKNNEKLKKAIESCDNYLQKMLDLLQEEQTKTNVKLRLRYNDALGYFFEVNKIQAQLLPKYFIRRQTLTNSERYTTETLTSLEGFVAKLKEECKQIEKEVLSFLVEEIQQSLLTIKKLSTVIAFLDLEICFAHIAIEKNYNKPVLSKGIVLDVENMRHPVIETMLINCGQSVIKNNIFIGETECTHILTGPNMSGKSTFLRQTALVVLMAHMGCFVPAEKAIIPETDRIFTRVGATDRLAKGESTFLVEMKETAHILHFASERSLVILDEIGRGTSTYDGLSLAYSIVDYITTYLPKMKTLFATHYHELTQMSEKKPSLIANYNVLVKENEESIIFLKKVARGVAKKSYGIHVAKLAGMPKIITDKAEKVLEILEETKQPLSLKNTIPTKEIIKKNATNKKNIDEENKKKWIKSNQILRELGELNLNETTPIKAFYLLEKWKEINLLDPENC